MKQMNEQTGTKISFCINGRHSRSRAATYKVPMKLEVLKKCEGIIAEHFFNSLFFIKIIGGTSELVPHLIDQAF